MSVRGAEEVGQKFLTNKAPPQPLLARKGRHSPPFQLQSKRANTPRKDSDVSQNEKKRGPEEKGDKGKTGARRRGHAKEREKAEKRAFVPPGKRRRGLGTPHGVRARVKVLTLLDDDVTALDHTDDDALELATDVVVATAVVLALPALIRHTCCWPAARFCCCAGLTRRRLTTTPPCCWEATRSASARWCVFRRATTPPAC